jgi:hypothetical protein
MEVAMNPQTRIPPSAQSMKAANASTPGIPTPGGEGGFPQASMPMPGEGPGQEGQEGPGGAPDLGSLIGQLAQLIQAQTGRPPTPQQLQAALAALMGGGGAPGGSPAGLPSPGAPPAMMGA